MAGSPDLVHVPAWLIAIVLALLPAALSWWWGRSLHREGDPAALPERHLALVQRVSAVTYLCSLVIGMVARWRALWIIALELVLLAWITHHRRRALLGETWPFHRYLLWRTRMIVGFWGFWWLLALAPAAVALSGPERALWAAIGVAVVAFGWHHWYRPMLLFALGASPVARADLEGSFDAILHRSTIPPPMLCRAGATGAVFANALALPSIRGNAVLFFDTLLERLSTDEIAAILAHEVAHLEHYTPRLRRLYARGVAFIAALIGSGAAAAIYAPDFVPGLCAASVVAVFTAFTLRARRMQPKETEADLRAIELCGNPEALISGLTRLHAINYVPRRWSVRLEERATHPSLARRIRAIRAHANAPQPQGPIERLVITSPEAGRMAFVDAERVGFLWCAGDMAEGMTDLFARAHRAEMVSYGELSELRLVVTRGTGLALQAVNRHARRWSMPIHERDAARVQETLDRVDHLIVPPVAAHYGVGGRIAALIVLLVAAIFHALIPSVIAAVFTMCRPTRRLLVALSAALTVSALLTAASTRVNWAGTIILVLLGALALWESWRARASPTTGHLVWCWIERAGFAIPVVVGLVLFAANGSSLFDLHTAVRDRSWFAAVTMSFAAFAAMSSRRVVRRLGWGAALLAGAAGLIGSPWFLLHLVGDPLAVSMPALTNERVPLAALSRRTVDGEFSSIALAIDGKTFLLAADDDESDTSDDDPARSYVVGGPDNWTRSFQASEAVLVDGQRLLAVDRDHDVSRLRAEDLRTGRVLWTVPIAHADVSMIQAASDGRWRALAKRAHRVTRFEGAIGSSAIHDTSWSIEVDHNAYVDLRVDDGPVALGIATAWHRAAIPWVGANWRSTTTLLQASVHRTTRLADSRLGVDCAAPPLGTAGFVCVSFDGRWSRLWRFDPETGTLAQAGQVRGGLRRVHQVTPTLVSARAAGHAVLVDIDSGTMRTIDPVWDGCGIDDFSIARDLVAVACTDRGATRVTLYRTGRTWVGPWSVADSS